MMLRPSAILVSLLTLTLLAGCGWPRVHKVIVQQGNVITQEMIDQLKPGMTRTQVAYIMGEPVVRNTFNDGRWDYVYSIENPGVYDAQSTVSLFFEQERLSYFVGDMAPTASKSQEQVAEAKDEEDALEKELIENSEAVEAREKDAAEKLAEKVGGQVAG